MGGKSKAQTIGYWYQLLLHLGIGRGELDALLEFRGGDKTAWIGQQEGNGVLTIDEPKLWGGEKAEGGIKGRLEVMLGGPAQGPSLLLGENGMGAQSYFRGRASVAFSGDYGAFNPYPKPASVRVRRILKGWDGDAPWYPEKAAVPLAKRRYPASADAKWADRDTGFFVIGAAQETSGDYASFQGWWHGYISSMRITAGVARTANFGYKVPDTEFGTTKEDDPYFGRVVSLLLMEGPEGSTDIVDVVGNTVTAFGGAHLTTARAKFGTSSCYFDGLDDYLKVAVGLRESLGAVWTMEAWVWLDSHRPAGSDYGRALFGYGPLGQGGKDTTWYVNGGAWHYAQLEPGDVSTVSVAQNAEPYPETGRWAFVSVCRDSFGRLWMHQDGKLLTANGDLLGFNPAHILYDSLTAQEMQGEPVGLVDEPTFIAAADRFYSEGLGLCTKYNPRTETVEAFQQRILDVAGASLTQSRITGKYQLTPIRGDYDLASLPILGDDNILEYSEQPSDPLEQVNQLTVEWFDPLLKEKRSTTPLQALGAIQAAGGIIADVAARPELAEESLALRIGARDLRQQSTPQKRFELTTDRTPHAWRAGQFFRLQAPRRGIADMVCMVGEIDAGTPRSGSMRLVAVQDVAGMPSTTYVTPEPGTTPDVNQAPSVPPSQAAFEAPYIDLVGTLSAADLAAVDPATGYLLTVAERPVVGTNYAIYSAASGETEAERATADWCPTLVVVGAATEDPTEVTFAYAQGVDLAAVAIGSAALWDNELVRVDALDTAAGTVTFGRGVGDTVPQKHLAGSRVWFYDQEAGTDGREYADGETVTARLVTLSPTGALPVDVANASVVTMDARQVRPYPPAKLQINGSYPQPYDPDAVNPPVAYRYWRVYITANSGDGAHTALGEVELRIAGVNQVGAGTANASSSYPGQGPELAFNNDPSQAWATAATAAVPSWVSYDFGAGNEKAIDAIALYPQAGYLARAPKDFQLQASQDGVVWTTYSTQAGVGWPDATPKVYAIDTTPAPGIGWTIDGSAADASVTWAHRDRIAQGDTLVNSTAASIGPEPTTRYALRLLNATTGALLVERTDLAGPSCTFALNYTGPVRAQLYSISDQGESLQRHDVKFGYEPNPATSAHVITGGTYTPPPTTIIDGGTVG